ncbi:cyclin-dependent kinase inhibitor 7-like [Primulina huaijiensis]|uniref:cyclin-dependent kinase inhibitor 7-like n=1 Tax=Primulina huaijiensis TaxID=1492673 RepID=UPI003CC6EA48
MAEYLKISERRKAMAEEDVQLIFCKKRKLCSENSVFSAVSVGYGGFEDDESSDDVQKVSRSPDLENVDSENELDSFETEISTPINGGVSSLSTPTSELCRDSEEVSMGSSTSKKKQLSQAVKYHRDLASPAAEKMPSADEIEEFFAAAEKCDQKRFAEKYNYDFLKDVPLEGRYQWVRLRP